VFTLTGPDFYPSAAYAVISKGDVGASPYVAALGAGPQDGFTGCGLRPAARARGVRGGGCLACFICSQACACMCACACVCACVCARPIP
jgi:hypothetical protein